MTYESLWKALVEQRKKTTTQKGMAEAMGTQQSHISDLETGVTGYPRIDVLQRYAKALNYVVVFDLERPVKRRKR